MIFISENRCLCCCASQNQISISFQHNTTAYAEYGYGWNYKTHTNHTYSVYVYVGFLADKNKHAFCCASFWRIFKILSNNNVVNMVENHQIIELSDTSVRNQYNDGDLVSILVIALSLASVFFFFVYFGMFIKLDLFALSMFLSFGSGCSVSCVAGSCWHRIALLLTIYCQFTTHEQHCAHYTVTLCWFILRLFRNMFWFERRNTARWSSHNNAWKYFMYMHKSRNQI